MQKLIERALTRANFVVKRVENQGADVGKIKQRTPYLTKSGDSLRSIAEEQLSDRRYLDLLITINRAEILFENRTDGVTPYFLPLTTLWLPTKYELEIYKRNFFTKEKEFSNKSFPRLLAKRVSSLSLYAMPDTQVSNEEASPSTVREEIDQDHSESNPLGLVLLRVRFSGNRHCVQVPRISAITSELTSNEGGNAKNGSAKEKEISRKGTNFPRRIEAESKLSVKPLASDCRLLTQEEFGKTSAFNVKLQLNLKGLWFTLIAYQSLDERTTLRLDYRQTNCQKSLLRGEERLSKEMTQAELGRHWHAYVCDYWQMQDKFFHKNPPDSRLQLQCLATAGAR